jgi:hypothetical protein
LEAIFFRSADEIISASNQERKVSMSEQFWYTWSDSGFGRTTGLRVRAASAGMTNTESEQMRQLINLVSYELPKDTDPYLPPEKAPTCLAFLRPDITGRKSVLIQKRYTGLDGMRRPGAYSSRLILDPPHITFSRIKFPIFTAREAIQLWDSTFWDISEEHYPGGKRDMPLLSGPELLAGPLKEDAVASLASAFRYVLSAFLKLPEFRGQQRLYIVAEPNIVAKLIWGLTNALPRTLPGIRNLTFTTYETALESKTLPTIVGTCWLPEHSRSSRREALDLPDAYYQPNNAYGFAINCNVPGRTTPLPSPHSPEISKFIDFGVKCFANKTYKELKEIIDEAEIDGVSGMRDLFYLYASYQEELSKSQVIDLLSDLFLKVHNVIEGAKRIFYNPTQLPSNIQMPRIGPFQLQAKMLKRAKVRESIIHVITQDSLWWQQEGRKLLDQLRDYSTNSAEQKSMLDNRRTNFINRVQDHPDWVKDGGRYLALHYLDLLNKEPADQTTRDVLYTFADSMMQLIQSAQNDLTESLTSLATDFIKQLAQAISRNQQDWTFLWADALTIVTPATTQANIGAELLHLLLSEPKPFTPLFQQWWDNYGKEGFKEISAEVFQSPQLASSLLNDAKTIVTEVLRRIEAAFDPRNADSRSNYRGQGELQQELELLLDLLVSLAPSDGPPASKVLWESLVDGVVLLASGIDSSGRIDLAYSWELRSLFLKTWGSVPALVNNETIQKNWLSVSWQDLTRLLVLNLPESWYIFAITQLINSEPDISADELMKMVNQRPLVFELALQQLMQVSYQQETAIDFFSRLVQHGYQRKVELLDGMMKACGYRQENAEKLLLVARIDSMSDIVNLLENHCKELLTSYILPPTLIQAIREYLLHLKADSLGSLSTRELLRVLQQRNTKQDLRLPVDLYPYVDLWGKLAASIAQPAVSGNWLGEMMSALEDISGLPQASAGFRQELAKVLVPTLVVRIATGYALGSAIVGLSNLLFEEEDAEVPETLQLLELLVARAGEKHRQEVSAARMVLYIEAVLEECQNCLPASKRNGSIDRLLDALLQHVNLKISSPINTKPTYWPDELYQEWEKYLARKRDAEIQEILLRFREALQQKLVTTIANSYDTILDSNKSVTREERDRLMLAQKFVEANKGNYAEPIVAAYQLIQKSPYASLLAFTPDQKQRIDEAHTIVHQARSSPASSATYGDSPAQSKPTPVTARTSPPYPQRNSDDVVASVNGRAISYAEFEHMLCLKELYLDYRINYLNTTIAEQKHTDSIIEKWRRTELKMLNDQVSLLNKGPQTARERILQDLIEDELILQAVPTMPEAKNLESQVEEQLVDAFGRFKAKKLSDRNSVISAGKITEEQAIQVVRIFRRREYFLKLFTDRGQNLTKWLEKRVSTAKVIKNLEIADIGFAEKQHRREPGIYGRPG